MKLPRHAPFSASRPISRPVSQPCCKPAPQGPRNAKRRQDFSCRQFVVGSAFREAVKPPLFVPVFRDLLLGQLCDGQPIGFDPGEDRLDNVRGKAVQGKDAGDVAGFQTGLAVVQHVHTALKIRKLKRFLNSLHSPNSEFSEAKTGFQAGGVGLENGPPFLCSKAANGAALARRIRFPIVSL